MGDTSSTRKPALVRARPICAEDGAARPKPPGRRYWFRALALIICPIIVLSYFIIITSWYIKPGSDEAVKFGRPGGRLVFYSWFIIGVIGLDLSRYGLLGAEAAMLEQPFWEAPNLVALFQHSNRTWGDPSGWKRSLVRIISRKRRDTHRLWYILSTVSLAFFVALPLSGLAIEKSDGYILTSDRPKVIGRTWDDFNSKDKSRYFPNARAAWEIGAPPTLPGFGVIFTPKNLPRDAYEGLKKVPNSLPLDESMPDMFIAPQAENPVAGRAWGLRARYQCDIVSDVSSLTLLNPRTSSRDWQDFNAEEDAGWTLLTRKGRGILDFFEMKNNIMAYGQVGFGSRSPIYNGSEGNSFTPEDLDRGNVLEYVLWQFHKNASYSDVADFSEELNPTIKGLDGSPIVKAENGSFVPNTTFFSAVSDIQKNIVGKPDGNTSRIPVNQRLITELANTELSNMADPIGIRCSIISTLGYAHLDPWTSTFDKFEQASKPNFNWNMSESIVPSLGTMAASTLYDGQYINIFFSINSPLARIHSNSEAFQGYIKPMDLQRSARLALATDALQLMYDGKHAFQGGWEHPNLTASEEAKVLTPGEFPEVTRTVIALFVCWALMSVVLGGAYGLRRRMDETMDGYAYFRLSTNVADDIKPMVGSLMSNKAHEIDALWNIPGSIGRQSNRA